MSSKVRMIREHARAERERQADEARAAGVDPQDAADGRAEDFHRSDAEQSTQRADKIRENRLRRAADRQGLILVKSRRRDPRAVGYGLFVLVKDDAGNRVGQVGGQAAVSAFAAGGGMTLDEIERELNS